MQIRIDDSSYSKKFHNILYSWDRYLIAWGGRGCFGKDQKVVTALGSKCISSIQKGEMVYCYNEDTGNRELRPVIDTFKYEIDEPLYSVTYDGIDIIATKDHKFYYGGSWVSLEYIVYLWHEYRRNMEANPRLYQLSRKQYRIYKNFQLEGKRYRGYNEASKRRKRIFADNAKRGRWGISYNKSTQDNSSDLFTTPGYQANSKSYKPYKRRQSGCQFGMDDTCRKFIRSLSRWTVFYPQRGASGKFNTKGASSLRDKSQIQRAGVWKKNACRRIRGKALYDKRHNKSQELGLAKISQVLIINNIKTVYDLSVKDNHNFYLDCGQHVLVHNSGKTDTFYIKYLICLFEPYYFRLAYINKELSNIRDQQYAGFKRVAKRIGVYDRLKFYDGDYRIVNPANGNALIPKGLDDPEKTKGFDDITAIWWDEINKGSKEDFLTLNELLRSPSAQFLQFALSFNPVSITHWLREYFFHPDDSHKLNPDFKGVALLNHSTYKDNEFIDQEAYLETLILSAGGDKNRLRVNVDGDWGLETNDDPWLYAFSEEKHVVEDIPFRKTYPVYLSFDFNRHPVSCIAVQHSPAQGMPDSFINFIREFTGDIQLDALCRQIKATYPVSILYVTGDSTGKQGDIGFNDKHASYYKMIQSYLKLADAQMKINNKNSLHGDSRQLCNTMLYNYPKISISRKGCPLLINDCHIAKPDEKSQDPNKLKKDRDLYKMDVFDCFRYYFQTFCKDYAEKVYFSGKQK